MKAGLNVTSFVLLYIRRHDLHRHRRAMTAAIWTSSLLLVFYLTRIALTGTHQFSGTGAAKAAYLR